MLLSLPDHDQAFGARREQPDGQIQASDEVEHFEEDHSLDTHESSLAVISYGEKLYMQVFFYVRNFLVKH